MSRVIDICFALLVLFIPFTIAYIILAPLIKLTSKGPVIFKQERFGYKKKVFVIYKFRSMYINDDNHHCKAEDPRLTPIGKVLRKLKIDELPQVLNILKGDMSVVGPRPISQTIAEETAISLACPERYSVKPGLACPSFLHLNNEYDREQYIPITVKCDKEYVEKKSIVLDIKLIILIGVHIIRKALR